MIEYLSARQIRRLHALLIERFGGAAGVRDRGALDAAIARPRLTFGGEDLYRDLPDKAAALMHSIVQSHPFVDGYKRVGAMALELFLAVNEKALVASDEELETITFAVARGEVAVESLAIWVRQRLRSVED